MQPAKQKKSQKRKRQDQRAVAPFKITEADPLPESLMVYIAELAHVRLCFIAMAVLQALHFLAIPCLRALLMGPFSHGMWQSSFSLVWVWVRLHFRRASSEDEKPEQCLQGGMDGFEAMLSLLSLADRLAAAYEGSQQGDQDALRSGAARGRLRAAMLVRAGERRLLRKFKEAVIRLMTGRDKDGERARAA